MFVIGYHQNESSQQHTQNLTIERQNSYNKPFLMTPEGGRKEEEGAENWKKGIPQK